MDVWEKYVGKKVFVILKNGRKYSGNVDDVEDAGNGIIFITLLGKDGLVTFTSGEIEVIEEEE